MPHKSTEAIDRSSTNHRLCSIDREEAGDAVPSEPSSVSFAVGVEKEPPPLLDGKIAMQTGDVAGLA